MRNIPANLRLYYLQLAPPSIENAAHVQAYFPSLEVLFPSIANQTKGSPTLASKELAIDISNGVAVVEDLLSKTTRKVPIWIRKVHLVEPIDVMSGDSILPVDGALPSFRSAWQRTLRKMNDPYNEAYSDAVFACMASRLVEVGLSPHFCRFFGTCNGRLPEYTYNITDDMNDIEGETWFRDGLAAEAYTIYAVDPYNPDVTEKLIHPFDNVRSRLLQADCTTIDSSDDDGDEQDDDKHNDKHEETDSVLSEIEEADVELSGKAVVNRSAIQLRRLSNHDTASDQSSGSEDDIEYRAILKDFPAQLTVLERCDGTMDDLMEDEIADDATPDMRETKEQRWTAWIFQVIAGLTTAQQLYEFVHNDLHTNNVMWSGTGETHLYYHVSGAAGGDRYYRVPTFGRIMKIIDFGRATFRPPVTDSRVWFPDSYAPDAVAGGQYNCGPYYRSGMQKVSPNKSFDLCRLAVAILDTLWMDPNEPVQPLRILTKEPGRVQPETTSPLWNLMWLWLTDKHGRNLLRNPDDSERYPNFDLYCAIARDAQNAVPAQQLTLPLFDTAFRCRKKDIPSDAHIWKLTATHKG